MIISSRGEYALCVLSYLAEHPADRPLTLREVARRLDLSEKYLEAIVKHLVRGGLLSAVRGKGGGYRLCRPPEEITLWEVLCLTEHDLKVGRSPRSAPVNWRLTSLMGELDTQVERCLSGYTVSDLMEREQAGNDYVI